MKAIFQSLDRPGNADIISALYCMEYFIAYYAEVSADRCFKRKLPISMIEVD